IQTKRGNRLKLENVEGAIRVCLRVNRAWNPKTFVATFHSNHNRSYGSSEINLDLAEKHK
ncbi:MAG: hypothetical protein CL681_29180, partial [Blastopirellula sp.]|nr:hypothetical protein [Blastopirellula sp.]